MTWPRGRSVLVAALALGLAVDVNAASSRAAPDRVAPRVAIKSPRTGATVGGAIRIAGVARDNRRVTAVDVMVDRGRFRRARGTRTWSFTLHTGRYRDGVHTLTVRARDGAGNGRRARIRLTFSNADAEVPRISVEAPAEGSSLRGNVTVSGNASDNRRVAAVEVRVDEGPYWTASGTGPWSTTIDTAAYANGDHTIIVRATDAAGNKAWARRNVAFRNGRGGIYWGAWMRGTTYRHLYGGTWGDAPWDANTWNRFEANAGKRVSIVHWGVTPPWTRDFNAWKRPFDLVHGRGAINLVSMDTQAVPLREIAGGRYDAAYARWAQQAKAWGRPWFLRWNAEMNGGWNPWGTTPSSMNTPAEFVAAWRRVHDIFARVGATNVTWVWCPNIEYWATVPYEQLYPGDGFVDWTCLDGYNKAGRTDTFANLFTPSYKHLLQLAPSKPIMIAETASMEYGAGEKAAWITDVLVNQLPRSFPRIKAVVWFNWRFNEDGVWKDFQIESSSAAQKAFRDGVAPSYYVPGGTFSALPALRPVPEP